MRIEPDRIGRDRAPRTRCTAAVLLGLLALVCAACSRTPAPSPRAADSAHALTLSEAQREKIRTETIASSAFHTSLETTGVVDFDNDHATAMLAPFSGVVESVLVAPGDRVAKGDVLARVDSPDFAAALASYRKAIASARTARKLADIDADLLAHEGVPAREAAQARTDATNAEADRDAAREALVALGVPAQAIGAIENGRNAPRTDALIRAPIAGTIVEKPIAPGQLLQAQTTAVFTIADLAHVWVMAQVPASEIGAIAIGDPADILVGEGGVAITGRVANIPAELNPDTRQIAVRVLVANPTGVLRKQMYVGVRIHSQAERRGLLVPVASILRDDENLPFVYIEQSDSSFARRRVHLGDRVGDRFEITEGLEAGEHVVVDGGLFVEFMQSQ